MTASSTLKPACLYVRVSTLSQGLDGYGIDAQRAAAAAFATAYGFQIKREFAEVDSGRRNDRPELEAALSYCRRHRATLVVAKLDRLSRDVEFIAKTMKSGVPFEVADRPGAGKMILGILAVVAEDEAATISARTKAGLAAAKARGVKLGTGSPERSTAKLRDPEIIARRQANSAKTRRRQALDAYHDVMPKMGELRLIDGLGYEAIAKWLRQNDGTTRTGAAWNAPTVRRVLGWYCPACEPERALPAVRAMNLPHNHPR
jgi:DNA invertase Pin-like site-specific DNA recombinase